MRNEALPGGVSLFSMNFTSKGLSWAENMRQKLEQLCTDSDIVQTSCKYIDAVGEHFITVFDEVAGKWLNPSDDCVKDHVANFSLEHGLLSEVSENSEVPLHQNPLDKHQLACVVLESVFSSTEELNSATTSNISKDSSQEIELNKLSKKLISVFTEVTASKSPDSTKESSTDVTYPVTSHANSPLISANERLPSEYDQNEVMEKELKLSGCSSEKIDGTCTSVGTNSTVRSIINDCKQVLESNRSEASDQVPEITVTESSDGFDSGRTFDVPNMFDQNAVLNGEFEDVQLEDCLDDTVVVELAFISEQASKNKSYKKKLKDAIISKVRSRKGYGQLGNSYGGTDLGLQSGRGVAASSGSGDGLCPETSTAHESCDSDWELL